MSGLFGALNVGKTGLMLSQKGVEVAGNNVTNANTEGYSRQTLEVSSAPSLEFNGTMVGQGAVATGIAREESVFVTQQLIDKSADFGEQDAMTESLEEVERIVSVSDNNLAADIDEFFVSWQSLSTDPSSDVTRQEVIQMGDIIADNLVQMNDELENVQENINVSIESEVESLNQMLEQVAELNQRIVSTEVTGDSANGLLDEQDLLLQELAQTIGIQTYTTESGMVSVQLSSGLPLVEGGDASTVVANRVAGDVQLTLNMGGSEATLGLDDVGGEIGGMLTVRDEVIPDVQSDLDQLAYTFANEINAIHEAGVDSDGNSGSAFFSYTTSSDPSAEAWTGAASTLAVAITEPSEVAVGTILPPDNTSGDNTNALAMVALQEQELVDGSTFNEFYSKIASGVGLDVERNEFELSVAEDALVQVQNMRDVAVGVSTDEELLLLTQYQSGYQASAKYISAVQDMLDVLMAI
ncbi:MAG: flagellar hook-associated protein FlgK [Desulfuromonas sp.]|nr:flagellar hook-associated protein FlgK [Desulfuromonas sp.]